MTIEDFVGSFEDRIEILLDMGDIDSESLVNILGESSENGLKNIIEILQRRKQELYSPIMELAERDSNRAFLLAKETGNRSLGLSVGRITYKRAIHTRNIQDLVVAGEIISVIGSDGSELSEYDKSIIRNARKSFLPEEELFIPHSKYSNHINGFSDDSLDSKLRRLIESSNGKVFEKDSDTVMNNNELQIKSKVEQDNQKLVYSGLGIDYGLIYVRYVRNHKNDKFPFNSLIYYCLGKDKFTKLREIPNIGINSLFYDQEQNELLYTCGNKLYKYPEVLLKEYPETVDGLTKYNGEILVSIPTLGKIVDIDGNEKYNIGMFINRLCTDNGSLYVSGGFKKDGQIIYFINNITSDRCLYYDIKIEGFDVLNEIYYNTSEIIGPNSKTLIWKVEGKEEIKEIETLNSRHYSGHMHFVQERDRKIIYLTGHTGAGLSRVILGNPNSLEQISPFGGYYAGSLVSVPIEYINKINPSKEESQ